MSSSYRALPLGRSGKVALVDAGDFLRFGRFKWELHKQGRVYRVVKVGGKWTQRLLSHDLLNLARYEWAEHLNGDGLDYRRANLRAKVGHVSARQTARRTIYRASFRIDDHPFYVGSAASREQAQEIIDRLADVARALRGRGLTRPQIRSALAVATGRAKVARDGGAELAQRIRAALPPVLPADVREEAEQELAVAVLDGRLTLEQLGRAEAVREHLRAASRLCVGRYRRGKHVSLDQPVAGGLSLIDVLAG